jgi:hypothetical protein
MGCLPADKFLICVLCAPSDSLKTRVERTLRILKTRRLHAGEGRQFLVRLNFIALEMLRDEIIMCWLPILTYLNDPSEGVLRHALHMTAAAHTINRHAIHSAREISLGVPSCELPSTT